MKNGERLHPWDVQSTVSNLRIYLTHTKLPVLDNVSLLLMHHHTRESPPNAFMWPSIQISVYIYIYLFVLVFNINMIFF